MFELAETASEIPNAMHAPAHHFDNSSSPRPLALSTILASVTEFRAETETATVNEVAWVDEHYDHVEEHSQSASPTLARLQKRKLLCEPRSVDHARCESLERAKENESETARRLVDSVQVPARAPREDALGDDSSPVAAPCGPSVPCAILQEVETETETAPRRGKRAYGRGFAPISS